MSDSSSVVGIIKTIQTQCISLPKKAKILENDFQPGERTPLFQFSKVAVINVRGFEVSSLAISVLAKPRPIEHPLYRLGAFRGKGRAWYSRRRSVPLLDQAAEKVLFQALASRAPKDPASTSES